MGGLHYDSLADLPPRMRERVAVRIVAKAVGPTSNKYCNQPSEVGGIKFASRKEAERYSQLIDAAREGVIYSLRLQQNFTLQEAYTTDKGERIRAIVYQEDFTYRIRWPWYGVPTSCSQEDLQYWASRARELGEGAFVIEDVKSKVTRTRVYQ